MRATRGQGPSMGSARRHLTWLRAEHDSDWIAYVDLTHSELFDWRHWLACRSDAETVVGNGVWAFWFVRICSKDTDLLDFRGDFLLQRVNAEFPDVRLRPQQAKQRTSGKREAVPVHGNWESWRPGASAFGRAEVALAAPQGRQPDRCITASRADALPLASG